MSSGERKLGEVLRSEREKRAVTLEQIAASTKINIRLLRSLEEEQFEELPVKPFVRSFVRSYCQFLGLDAETLLNEYDDYLSRHCRRQDTPDRKFTGYAFEKRDQDQTRKVLWAVLGSFAVIGGVALLILKPALKHRKNRHAEELRSQQQSAATGPIPVATPTTSAGAILPQPSPTPTPKATPSPKPTPTPKLSPKPAPTATPMPYDSMQKGADLRPEEVKEKLLIKVKEDVWVRYQVDDRKIMSFLLRGGLMLSLKAKQIIRFQTARPELTQYKIPGRTGYNVMTAASIVIESRQATDDATLFSTEKALP